MRALPHWKAEIEFFEDSSPQKSSAKAQFIYNHLHVTILWNLTCNFMFQLQMSIVSLKRAFLSLYMRQRFSSQCFSNMDHLYLHCCQWISRISRQTSLSLYYLSCSRRPCRHQSTRTLIWDAQQYDAIAKKMHKSNTEMNMVW